ncbi:MAG: flagellar assembly protein FliW [Hungatella sp.]
MNTNTRYFGDITYEEKDILHLPDGLFGFEKEKQYVLIHFEEGDSSLLCLQSLQEESLAFVLTDPFWMKPDYDPQLSKDDMEFLQLSTDSVVSFYAICVIHEPLEDSTMNLMCPIAINPVTRRAKQVVLDNTAYTFRHPFRKPITEREGVKHC